MESCPQTQQEFCKFRFDNQDKKLDIVDTKLDTLIDTIKGNGRIGLIMRIDRLEQARKRHVKLIWIAISCGATLVVSALGHWVGF